jgi:hypothetical protein
MIDVSRVPAVDRPLDGAPVRLPLERHVELDELLAALRLAEIAALLGPEGAQLAAAFADSGCTSGRLSRSWRTPDEGLAVACCAWVAHAGGAWLITDADPDDAYPATTFTPVDDATLRAEIARVRDGAQREAAPA